MRVLIDCDVLLDVALAREPFVHDSANILRWSAEGGDAAIAWHTYPTAPTCSKMVAVPF